MSSSHPSIFVAKPGERPGEGGRSIRVLVVGEALAKRVHEAVAAAGGSEQAKVTVTPSFLAALGELARQPADVVVGSAMALTGMADSMAGCVRQLAPGARLVVVADRAQRGVAETALRHGFDALATEPADAATLARAIGVGEREPEAGAGERVMVETAREVFSGWKLTGAEQRTPAEDEELGDVDLVEAVLHGRETLGPLAMRIVQVRSGIAGIAWAPAAKDVPEEQASAAVRYRGKEFGFLHAPGPTSAAELSGWAAWLSRWLALDEQVHELEELSMKDELTGAWNRRYFNRFLEHILSQAGRDRSQVTLLVFDIDDFKLYNDRYGHAAGDDILREATRLMRSFVREHDVVARIGGDEFAVIFWDAGAKRRPDSHHPETVRHAAQRFQKAICQQRFPKLLDEAPGTLTISGGLASFPWDGRTPQELLEKADQMALQSKRQGKNAITFGPGGEGCEPGV